MSAHDEFIAITDEIDLLVAELKELNAQGPHFRIVHRFHEPGTDCAPGEEIAGIYLVHRGKEYHLRLSLALRLLFDYLARHSHLAQSASQIEAGIRAERFYLEHGASLMSQGLLNRSIPRTYIRIYMERLDSALTLVLKRADLGMRSDRVLLTERTVMNEVGYRLRGSCEYIHIDAAAQGTPYTNLFD